MKTNMVKINKMRIIGWDDDGHNEDGLDEYE